MSPNTLTSTSSILSTGSVTSAPPTCGPLGVSIQQRNNTEPLRRVDSGSVTRHVIHHRDSTSWLYTPFTSTPTGTVTPTLPPLRRYQPSASIWTRVYAWDHRIPPIVLFAERYVNQSPHHPSLVWAWRYDQQCAQVGCGERK